MGHIAILDDKPMDRDPRAIDVVKVFAARAAAELKRQRAEADCKMRFGRSKPCKRNSKPRISICRKK
jgi:hypothetical protein